MCLLFLRIPYSFDTDHYSSLRPPYGVREVTDIDLLLKNSTT